MAGINWTASQISSFFQTSLNQSSTGMNNLYSLLGDKALIRSGSYHKLMDAYVKKVESEKKEASNSDSKQNTTTYDSTGTKKDSVTTDSIIDTLI